MIFNPVGPLRYSLGLVMLGCSLMLTAQDRINVGVHFTPQLRFITSTLNENPVGEPPTWGGSGEELGYGAGAYLEYELLPSVLLRAGVDYSRRRHRYAVETGLPESATRITGTNRIVYTCLELPVSVAYQFASPRDDRRGFLLGVGAVANRWLGDEQLDLDLNLHSGGSDDLHISPYSLLLFAGYEHPIDDVFLVGWAPYVAYPPTSSTLESHPTARVAFEAGLAIRFVLDN